MGRYNDDCLTLQAKEAVRKYMLTLVVLPGTLLAVVSFFLGFFINEVAKQGAYNEAYSQASGVIMATAAEAAKTSGKIDALYAQANILLAEAEETRKIVELSASDIASKVAKKLSNDTLFVKKATQPLAQMGENLEQRLKDKSSKVMTLDKKVKAIEKNINEIKSNMKTNMKTHLDRYH